MLDDQGAKRLVAAVLKQAYEDYQNPNRCPDWCPMTNCNKRQIDRYACDVLQFIKSAWCSTLCDAIDINAERYSQAVTDSRKINKQTFNYIEEILRFYKQTLSEYEMLHREILEGAPVPDVTGIRANTPSDPTQVKAAALVNNKRLNRLAVEVNAVKYVYEKLDKDKQRMLEMKYWRNQFTDRGIMEALCIDRATFYRWRKAIVYSIANELGL